jgi:hypothetical protein
MTAIIQRTEARGLEKRYKGKSRYMDKDRDKSEDPDNDKGGDEDERKDEDGYRVGSKYLFRCNEQITM